MTKPLISILLLIPLSTLAQTQVPNVFMDGTPATAVEVNENFDALETVIDALPTPPTDCTIDQVIKWDGLAWVCATDPFAGLTCDVGGYLRMGVDGWQCVYCSDEEEHEGEENEGEDEHEDHSGDCLGV